MATGTTSDIGRLGRAEVADTRLIEHWLVVIALMVALTAVIGAATRLTGSGLSITEWQPIMGVLPPLNDAQWHEAFEKYKQIPQYEQLNRGMSLAAFKSIFWWEWFHRLVARSIGLVFVVPMIAFAALGRLPRSLVPRLVLLLALGGLQGGIGWFMVKSGLAERISVSQYRLALHLSCAVLILALTVWTILELRDRRRPMDVYLSTVTRRHAAVAAALVALVFLQIVSGALVAGLKAGLTYNTWPLMDGRLVPDGLATLSPGWLNLFENVATVQFDHRLLAYAVAALAVWQAVSLGTTADDGRVRASAAWLLVAILAQVALGIWTLLAWVPLSLGIAHQAGALIVMTLALVHLFTIRRARSAG